MNELEMMKRQLVMQRDVNLDLQEQAQQAQERLAAPQLRDQIAEAQAAVIAQTNPARALKIVLKGFEGYVENEEGDFERLGKEIMNEEGRSKVASILIPFINDAIRFGNISEKEVRSICLQTMNDITEDIGVHWREYGIIESSYKNLILDALLALILITLTRSEGQGEKNWLSRVIVESVGNKPQKKESGGWRKHFKL